MELSSIDSALSWYGIDDRSRSSLGSPDSGGSSSPKDHPTNTKSAAAAQSSHSPRRLHRSQRAQSMTAEQLARATEHKRAERSHQPLPLVHQLQAPQHKPSSSVDSPAGLRMRRRLLRTPPHVQERPRSREFASIAAKPISDEDSTAQQQVLAIRIEPASPRASSGASSLRSSPAPTSPDPSLNANASSPSLQQQAAV